MRLAVKINSFGRYWDLVHAPAEGARHGVATSVIGVGQGIAVVVERR